MGNRPRGESGADPGFSFYKEGGTKEYVRARTPQLHKREARGLQPGSRARLSALEALAVLMLSCAI